MCALHLYNIFAYCALEELQQVMANDGFTTYHDVPDSQKKELLSEEVFVTV